MAKFAMSMPDRVIATWSPAKTELQGSSSRERVFTVACSLEGQTRTLSFVHRTPASIRPETQKPEPAPLKTSFMLIRKGLSMARSGILKVSITVSKVGLKI